MERGTSIWGRAATTTIESDIDRIRKEAWLKVFTSPERIISFKMVGIDTLVEGKLDMELNFIHVKGHKNMNKNCFTSVVVSG